MMSRAQADLIAPPCEPVAVADCRDYPTSQRWIGTQRVVEFLRANDLPRQTYRIELLNLDAPCLRIFAYVADTYGRMKFVSDQGGGAESGDRIAVEPPRIVPLRTDWPEPG